MKAAAGPARTQLGRAAPASSRPTPRLASAPVASLSAVPAGPVIQAKCAECAAEEKTRPPIQPSLAVGATDDRYEREADRIAEQVVSESSAPRGTLPVTPVAQGSPVEQEGDTLQKNFKIRSAHSRAPGDKNLAIRAVSGEGRSLSFDERAYFEPRLGRDFSNVRIHEHAKAGEAARAINAQAYTLGTNIAFARGEYSPQSLMGRRLLAHELTHVIQQSETGSGAQQQMIQRQHRSTPVSSSEEDFIQDLQTGTERANQYISYITEAIEYWRNTGIRLSGLDRALDNLDRISRRVKTGLDHFDQLLAIGESAFEIRRWFEKVDEFAAFTRAIDISDPESLRRWADSMEELRQQTQPFIDAVSDWLGRHAWRGSSSAAGHAAFFLRVISAYAEVGLAGLRAGIHVINTGVKRRHRIIEEHFAAAEDRVQQGPPAPDFPGDWLSAEQKRERARSRAEFERRTRERLERERAAQQARRDFDSNEFPRIYMRHRSRLRDRILSDIRRGLPRTTITLPEGSAVLPGLAAQRWWDILTSSGGDTYFDKRAGVYIRPKKWRITRTEAENEIAGFQRVRPRCPYFDELYSSRLREYLSDQARTQQRSSP